MKTLRDQVIFNASKLAATEGPFKKFREILVHNILAVMYPLYPDRRKDLPGLLKMTAEYLISLDYSKYSFPPVEKALKKPDGLLAIGGKFDSSRLLSAYRKGIYPHSHIGPIKWYSPQSRMVLFVNEAHIGKTLRQLIRKKKYRISFDYDFENVIHACAEPRKGKTPVTWITKKIINAYSDLYNQGHAHSIEVWDNNGCLVGGLYGVAIGKVFFNESMFARKPDTSKLALAYLNCHLQDWGYVLNDIKSFTPFWKSQGARLIRRNEFNEILKKWCNISPLKKGHWNVDNGLNVGKWHPDKGIITAKSS